MIEAALHLLVFGFVQPRFLGKHGSLVNDGHYRIGHRNVDSGTEEESPQSMLDISFNLAPFDT